MHQACRHQPHGAFGLCRAWALAAASKLTEVERDAFLDAIAGLCMVEQVMATTRHTWHPVGSNGPQYGEWAEHANVLRAYLGCATKVIAAGRKAEAEAELRWRAFQKKEAAKKRRAKLKKAAKVSP